MIEGAAAGAAAAGAAVSAGVSLTIDGSKRGRLLLCSALVFKASANSSTVSATVLTMTALWDLACGGFRVASASCKTENNFRTIKAGSAERKRKTKGDCNEQAWTTPPKAMISLLKQLHRASLDYIESSKEVTIQAIALSILVPSLPS